MSKPRLGLDIDGVLRNIYTPLLSKLRNKYPLKEFPNVSQWKDYKIWNNLGIEEQELKKLWFNDWATEVYWHQAQPYKGVKKEIDRLKYTYDIILISAQPNRLTMGLTMAWLDIHKIYFDEIHFTEYSTKRKIEVDYIVEDSPYQIEKFHCKAFSFIYIMDRPWNRDITEEIEENEEATRIKSLKEIK